MFFLSYIDAESVELLGLHTAREKHSLDAFLVVAANDSRVVEVAFLSGLLLGQDVTVIGMLSLDLTSAGESEALLGT
jgi:hypothetical protein